jgi:hypothetical protein
MQKKIKTREEIGLQGQKWLKSAVSGILENV